MKGFALIKNISFISNIAYAVFGGMLFFTKIFWVLDPLNFQFYMAIGGVIYIACQLSLPLTMSSKGVWDSGVDNLLSMLPLVPVILWFAWGHGPLSEWGLYTLFWLIDVVLIGPITQKLNKLLPEIAIERWEKGIKFSTLHDPFGILWKGDTKISLRRHLSPGGSFLY